MASPPTVAFTVVAQLCGPKANDMEMGAPLFTENGEGRNFLTFEGGRNRLERWRRPAVNSP